MEHTISATELARRLGDVLARVRYRQEAFVVERNGRAVAHIVPARAGAADATLADALTAWSGAAPRDAALAGDLERVGAADRPPVNPWAS
ncbi:MAG: type II toxin-antitoxin system Phd/YefM family antitoxin [Acidobacteria bacterium]|nr:type II toxin-antitoxin system Phd/YefM family antitoxin [Acidobacteriota bacterium]